MIETRRLLVTGLVQGVGFRYHTANAARRLNISGYVNNRGDGSVEAVISGTPEAIAAMLNWIKTGPPPAKVGRVFVEQMDSEISFEGFEQRETV